MNPNSDQKIVTRVAPSPTGLMHIGTARVALFNYLFTKQKGGKLVLRIEDTDKERSTPEYEKNIMDGLGWLGLGHDEFFRQSDRLDIYKKYLKELVDKGSAYLSKEEIKKEGDRAEVIRFKNPNKKVTFHDLIHGDITMDTSDLGDFVIAKDMETPIFHLANVVDDKEMGITHVIRGDDHMSNTPRQILIMEAIGATIPTYAHLPMILSPDKAKLSKRHGAWPVTEYRDQGYLKEAIINFVALLGWSPQAATSEGLAGTNEELLSLDDLLKRFDLMKVQKKGAVFSLDKLNWINKEYIKKLSAEDLDKEFNQRIPERVKNLPGFATEKLKKLKSPLIERIHNFGQLQEILENGEYDYFFQTPSVDKTLLKSTEHLPAIIEQLETIEENDFSADKIKSAIWDFATEKGRGAVLWPMRVALSGQEKSPDPFTIAEILGKKETLLRLANAK